MSAPSPALFFETVNAFQRTQALKAAVELDLFSAIASGANSVDSLAAKCQAAPRGIRILADYLTVLGFLAKSDTTYSLTPDSSTFLTRQSPAYLGGTLGFLLAPTLTACFQDLTGAVRHGGTVVSAEGTVSDENPVWVDFARSMAPMMQLPAQQLVALIRGRGIQPRRVLDVAAGHGVFGIQFAREFPQAHVTGLDWGSVLAVARENASRAGVADRYQERPGSAFETDWGGPYDLVLLPNFLHHFSPDQCVTIARRAAAALVPGGHMITVEFIPNPDRISPVGSAIFALTMLATTARGDAYPFADYDAMFQQAGFTRNEFFPLPPTMQQVILSSREA